MRVAQQEEGAFGLVRVLGDRRWTPWLPVFAWCVTHPEGVFVVDTGDTVRVFEPGYYPAWHPYFWNSLESDISPDEEVGPRLRALGIDPARDVTKVVLTHFHSDHMGGLRHFPGVPTLSTRESYKATHGPSGRLNGYLPQHFPAGFDPLPLQFDTGPIGTFARSHRLTQDGAVSVVETPGHAPGHVSVLVRREGLSYLLAGDTSYSQPKLKRLEADAVTPTPNQMRETQRRILALASKEPLVYLPSHDTEAVARLEAGTTLQIQSSAQL